MISWNGWRKEGKGRTQSTPGWREDREAFEKRAVIGVISIFLYIRLKSGLMKTVLFCGFLLTMSFVSHADQGIRPGLFVMSSYADKGKEQVISGFYVNEDHSFTYFDKSSGTEIKGTWSIENGKLLFHSEQKLPVKASWKITGNESCFKARKGMTFYRLCNC